MRNLIFAVIVFVLVFGVWKLTRPQSPKSVVISTATPVPSSPQPGTSVHLDEKTYRILTQKILDPEKLTLIPNFTEKKSTQQIMQEENCLYGANGGFYTPDGKPLGLYYVNGQYVNKFSHTEGLFNGYVHKTTGGLFLIIDAPPHYTANALDFAFQSGPLFRPETRLTLNSDKEARRILIGQVDASNFYFLAITEEGNTYNGPKLGDVPEIINRYNNKLLVKKEPGQFLRLLNLDGGAASAFFSSDGIRLPELTPVGSFLCGKI